MKLPVVLLLAVATAATAIAVGPWCLGDCVPKAKCIGYIPDLRREK